MNGPDDIYTFAYLEGAFICVIVGSTLLALVLAIALLVRDALRWRQFERACGGEKAALEMLAAAEEIDRAASDVFNRHAFKAANRLGLLPRDLR